MISIQNRHHEAAEKLIAELNGRLGYRSKEAAE